MKTDHARVDHREMPAVFTSVNAFYVNLKNVEVLYTFNLCERTCPLLFLKDKKCVRIAVAHS